MTSEFDRTDTHSAGQINENDTSVAPARVPAVDVIVDASECSVRNISGHNGPADFEEQLRQAEKIQAEIAEIDIKSEENAHVLSARLAPLEMKLITQCFRVCRDASQNSVLVQQYLHQAKERSHGNQRIACSTLVRAIVAPRSKKDAPGFKNHRRRSATYASAIDHAMSCDMSESAFLAELNAKKKAGRYHGIEHLAKLGRKNRSNEAQPGELEREWSYTVIGDFAQIEQGLHLFLLKNEVRTSLEGPLKAAHVKVSPQLLARVLEADANFSRHNQTRPASKNRPQIDQGPNNLNLV